MYSCSRFQMNSSSLLRTESIQHWMKPSIDFQPLVTTFVDLWLETPRIWSDWSFSLHLLTVPVKSEHVSYDVSNSISSENNTECHKSLNISSNYQPCFRFTSDLWHQFPATKVEYLSIKLDLQFVVLSCSRMVNLKKNHQV